MVCVCRVLRLQWFQNARKVGDSHSGTCGPMMQCISCACLRHSEFHLNPKLPGIIEWLWIVRKIFSGLQQWFFMIVWGTFERSALPCLGSLLIQWHVNTISCVETFLLFNAGFKQVNWSVVGALRIDLLRFQCILSSTCKTIVGRD